MSRTQKTFLEQLYDGELFPSEKIVSQDPAYYPTQCAISEIAEALSGRLDGEDKVSFARMMELMNEAGWMSDYANFAYGFRMGACIMRELAAME